MAMWNELFESLRRVLTLADRVEQNRQQSAALQKELNDFIKAVEQQFAAIALEFQRVHTRLDNLEKDMERERRFIILELENRLLRAKLELPPAADEAGD